MRVSKRFDQDYLLKLDHSSVTTRSHFLLECKEASELLHFHDHVSVASHCQNVYEREE